MGRRVPASGTRTRQADRHALATIAYEWMFGRPISAAGDRPVDVRSLPGVDRTALSRAFTRALSPEPSRRFGSCADFVDAIAESVIPSLPLMAGDDDNDPVGPLIPEEPAPAVPIAAPTPGPDLSFTAEASNVTAAEPDLDAMNPVVTTEPAFVPSGPEEQSAFARAPADHTAPRFSGVALILAAIVGMVAGFAAGYMARPRALQSGPPAEIASGTDNDLRTAAPSAPPLAPEARKAATPAPQALSAPQVPVQMPTKIGARAGGPPRPSTPSASAAIGRSGATGALAIDSRPAGASVLLNGKPIGTTPMLINDLAPGDYRVTMSLPGYRNVATTVRVVAGERARAAARLTEQEQE